METEENDARKALDMFCRAAEKATGDYWGIQQMENGSLAVVQTFRSAKEALDDPKVPDEEKRLIIAGAIVCMSSRNLADLARQLVSMLSQGPLYSATSPVPLPFLKGCASVEEMTVRLAACC